LKEENDEQESFFEMSETDLTQEIEDLKDKETSQMELVWLRFKRNKLALFGLTVFTTLIIVAIFAPFIAPHDPLDQNVTNSWAEPSREHLLGTDNLGRDTFSRLIFGTRIALMIGVLIVAVSGGIGIALGLLAGAFGGWVDELIMRLVDAFMAFPVLIVGMALATALGHGLYPVIIAVGLVMWTRFARITRSETLSIKQEKYIESAKAIGESRFVIITRYIFPNLLPSVVVVATIMMPSAILFSAALNFLGIGVQPPTPAWGEMVNTGRVVMQWNPWMVTFSGLSIVVTVLAFNFIGDGLRDALDPIRKGG